MKRIMFLTFMGCLFVLLSLTGCGDDETMAPTGSRDEEMEDSDTFKLTYSLNWQTIVIGTFADNELVYEQFITSSQNPNSYETGDLKPSWSKSGNYITFMRTISGSANGQGADIRTAVINLNSLEIKVLTTGNFEEYHPTWYRDGSNRVIACRLTHGAGWSNYGKSHRRSTGR